MAISHVCLSCGLDLARVRARLDPHYALPLVLCPDCGAASVRRRPRLGRNAARLAVTLAALVAQVTLLAAGLAVVVGLSFNLAATTALRDFGTTSAGEMLLIGGAYLTVTVLIGVWLTVAFGHHRRVVVWLIFTTLAAAVLSVGSLAEWAPQRLPLRLLWLATIMTVAVAGVPVGGMAIEAGHWTRRMAWRAWRRRLRARSAGR